MLKNNIVQSSAPYYNPLILELSCIVEKKKKKKKKQMIVFVHLYSQPVRQRSRRRSLLRNQGSC